MTELNTLPAQLLDQVEIKPATRTAELQTELAAEPVTEKNRASTAAKPEAGEVGNGSLASHLLFGLGTLVFVLPMLIPGIPMGTLVVIYGGMFVAVTLAFVLWSVVARIRERRPRP
jgi:hypothetical protein